MTSLAIALIVVLVTGIAIGFMWGSAWMYRAVRGPVPLAIPTATALRREIRASTVRRVG